VPSPGSGGPVSYRAHSAVAVDSFLRWVATALTLMKSPGNWPCRGKRSR
jgi:hypothetical protein